MVIKSYSIISISLILIFFYSCKPESVDKSDLADITTDTVLISQVEKTIFDSIELIPLPYKDTIFNSPITTIDISEYEISKLHLETIDCDSIYDSVHICLVGRIDFSKSFYSIIANYSHDNFTDNYLINYNDSFGIIDFIHISGDEWAESSSWTKAWINRDSIVTVFTESLCEPICIEKKIYSINADGKFVIIRVSSSYEY